MIFLFLLIFCILNKALPKASFYFSLCIFYDLYWWILIYSLRVWANHRVRCCCLNFWWSEPFELTLLEWDWSYNYSCSFIPSISNKSQTPPDTSGPSWLPLGSLFSVTPEFSSSYRAISHHYVCTVWFVSVCPSLIIFVTFSSSNSDTVLGAPALIVGQAHACYQQLFFYDWCQ